MALGFGFFFCSFPLLTWNFEARSCLLIFWLDNVSKSDETSQEEKKKKVFNYKQKKNSKFLIAIQCAKKEKI